ncbi:MAG: BMP family ABC transporter substrate-binding protein [Ilumatobacter sp.]|nr:BMP family ABC transporter substrate-binding protein [Ilumatobacter sp.]
MVGSGHAPVIDGIEGMVLVGEGGFAIVYRGHQPAFRRDVAVKVLQRTGLGAEDRRRFDRECQAMGALSDHPGIVTLYDAGFTEDHRPYMVMPFVSEGTLADRLAAAGPLSWQDVTELGVRLCGALETAHRAGVLHRDIKPANILRSRYGDQLSDFGIARIQGGHETRSGVITASVAHAAPEILDGLPPSPQADVYALASTLFEALTGHAAFVSDTDEGLLPLIRRVLTDQPPDLREHGVPSAVARLIETAMAKNPADRYATAEEFGLAIRGAQAVLGIHVADLVIVGMPDVGRGAVVPAEDAPETDADAGGGEANEAPAEPSAPPPGAGQTIVVEPPTSVSGDVTPPDRTGDVPPRDGPPAGDGGRGEPNAGDEAGPPVAAFATTEPAVRSGRKKVAIAAGSVLGVTALVVGAILLTQDGTPDAVPPPDSTPPATAVATSPPTSLEDVPATTTAPATTVAPETTVPATEPPVVPDGPVIGVIAPGAGADHPAVRSLTEVAAELDVVLTPSNFDGATDAELAALIENGQDTIIALADDATGATVSALIASAEANPEVDYVVIDAIIDAPNVASTSFADHEGSFMVGAIAAMTSTTGRVGFIGGVDNLRVRRYEAGFVAGARHVSSTVQVDVRYLAGDGEQATDEALERDTAAAMYDLGADVVYHAGTPGIGLYEAAAAAPDRWAIGVDTDRAATAPAAVAGSILTSMTKAYDVAASDALRGIVDDTLFVGNVPRSLADGGLSWATTGGHIDALAADLATLADDVTEGRIEVPSLVEGRAFAPLSADCPAEGCRARIIAAEIVGGELAVTLEANWFFDEADNHLHYFWSPRYEPNQVGMDSAERFGVEVGEWDIDGRYPVYVTEDVVSLSSRTVEDTRLCLTAADAAHNVIDPELFDCLIFTS